MTDAEKRKALLDKLGDGRFASFEELYFYWYLADLEKYEYIEKYTIQPTTHIIFPAANITWLKQMKTKVVPVESSILQETTYTTDFKIHWTKKAFGVFIAGEPMTNKPYFLGVDYDDVLNEYTTEVDVKGGNTSANVRGNHSMITFPLKQKMLYMHKGIFVQKVIPAKLFRDTFVPTRYFFTDTGLPGRKLTGIKKPLTINEYVKVQTSFKKK